MTIALALGAAEAQFEFEAGPYDASDLAVVGFRGKESLSQPFEIELELASDRDLDPRSVLGLPATLTILGQRMSRRYINGTVLGAEAWDFGRGGRRRRHRFTLGPLLSRLGFTQKCRIFQNLSVPDLVKQVLEEGQVPHRHELSHAYAERVYCVQYRESDLAFVSRLLEEEGIFYFFEHTADKHVLVMGDTPDVHKELPGGKSLHFRAPSQMIESGDAVHEFLLSAAITPGVVHLRDYQFENPALDLSATRQGEAEEASQDVIEVYDYPGYYHEPDAGARRAQVRLEEFQASAIRAAGATNCPRLIPGYRCELKDHGTGEFNQGYLVVSVTHFGRQSGLFPGETQDRPDGDDAEGYHATFVCQPAAVPYRPERLGKKPELHGPQTATVVGPPGEEIYTDDHGRVKVQFHWDRAGQRDDKSSCWLRVAHASAGTGWGAFYLPRIGQEVVVDFLDGDVDRPLVTGCVYNGQNPPPFSPEQKTQTIIRTRSTPGGDGANELSFEDAAGNEQVYLHAQRDLQVVVENDKQEQVGGNQMLQVEKDRTKQIKGNQNLSVGRDDSTSIGGSQSLAVMQDRSVTIGGSKSETVVGSVSSTVGGARSLAVTLASNEMVGLGKSLLVGGAYAVTVGGLMNEAVAGMKTETAGGARIEVVAGKKTESVLGGGRSVAVKKSSSETVGGNRRVVVKGDLENQVQGLLKQRAQRQYHIKARDVTLSADENCSIHVAGIEVQMKKSGHVVVKAKRVVLLARDKIILNAAQIKEN